jgi:hypothetical protein
LVAAHDAYLSWLTENTPGTKKKFMNRIKLWLTGSEKVDDSEIANLKDVIGQSLDGYKIITWQHDLEIDNETNNVVIEYVENGGSLFCGSTPWGYLQIYPHKKLTDMCLYQFLKFYTGIFFTPVCLNLPNESEVSHNKSKYSQFDIALEQVCSNPSKIAKYSNTLQSGFDILYEEGLLTADKILELQEMVMKQCKNCGWNVIPKDKQPVCDIEQINALKLIAKSYNYTESVKAPGVEEFPGDFKTEPELLENIRLEISSQFQERISTGFYLPAGTILIINICSGDYEGWCVRIGAHSDDLGKS